MSLPNYDFGQPPRQLTDEMLQAALVACIDRDVLNSKQAMLIVRAGDILALQVPGGWMSTDRIVQLADQVLLAWPEP